MRAGEPLPREFFDRDSRRVARDLLGCVLTLGGVSVRLTELEAYLGSSDPGSHAFRGETRRNATMFGPPGHVYVYFTYGMHWCANLVCEPPGTGTAVLLRAGEVVGGLEEARSRRPAAKTDRELCRGPARLASALGLTGSDDGLDAVGALVAGARVPASRVRTGPRVGVSGAGAVQEWRWWIDGDPTVSVYRPAKPRSRKPVVRSP
ncbi:DNA-3-methyladenine glycosylase [Spongisporangium articulatum]|uniref:Putative 3-methyladenine DNA glycosylase n=1 Tax=Spongisporangium articulatum TaxID=3362603 RepID=A0ABW8ASK0_9ACTN